MYCNGKQMSNTCTFIKYPNHCQKKMRAPCGAKLMKTVQTHVGTSYLYPKMLYCFKSIIEMLKERISSPKFIQARETWRSRIVEVGMYSDVYDGKISKDFMVFPS